MKEIISINVGQAGVQLSSAIWELLCIEEGVRSDGTYVKTLDYDGSNFKGVFFESLLNTVVPRCISIDFEPTVVDEVRTGAYKRLFHPDCLISGGEDCANNFARGSYSVGKLYIKPVMQQTRRQVEKCDSLQGFCFFNSFDGGTGAGFGSSLLEELTHHYAKRSKFQLGVYPSRMHASSVVYPYNGILHTNTIMNHTDLTLLLDNEALYSICINKLYCVKPSFSQINRIISQVFSNLSVSMRYPTQVNNDIDQLCTNLVPYPRVHFPVSHLAPLLNISNQDKESRNLSDLTRDIFDSHNQLVNCNLQEGQYMACVLQFRGLISPTEVNRAIVDIKRRTDIQFVDWCPTGFKIGISCKPSAVSPGSLIAPVHQTLSMLSNSTTIVEIWSQLLRKYESLYSRRAFIHWFIGEGLEESEFNDAFQNIRNLEMDYFEIAEPFNEWYEETGGIRSYDNPKKVKSMKSDNIDKKFNSPYEEYEEEEDEYYDHNYGANFESSPADKIENKRSYDESQFKDKTQTDMSIHESKSKNSSKSKPSTKSKASNKPSTGTSKSSQKENDIQGNIKSRGTDPPTESMPPDPEVPGRIISKTSSKETYSNHRLIEMPKSTSHLSGQSEGPKGPPPLNPIGGVHYSSYAGKMTSKVPVLTDTGSQVSL